MTVSQGQLAARFLIREIGGTARLTIRPLIIPWCTLTHAKHKDGWPLQVDRKGRPYYTRDHIEEVEGLDDVARVQ